MDAIVSDCIDELSDRVALWAQGKEEGLKPYLVAKELGGDENIATEVRCRALEKYMDKPVGTLEYVRKFGQHVDWNRAVAKNIDNPIGGYPYIGWAGNIRINGKFANGYYPALIAIDEKQVVSGTARGISVLNKSGGVNTRIYSDHMTRDVVAEFYSINDALDFYEWLKDKENILEEHYNEGPKGPGHGKFEKVDIFPIFDGIHVKFYGTCGAAMGMNDLTERGQYVVRTIVKQFEEKTNIVHKRIIASGNVCIDKKAGIENVRHGRGLSIVTWATVSKEIVQEIWKCEPEDMLELYTAKDQEGSRWAGSVGVNSNVANPGIGLFLAFGQDKAQVTELSVAYGKAILTSEGDLGLMYDHPAIEVGTIGGATESEQPKELLTFLGFYGAGDDEGITRKTLGEYMAAVMFANDTNIHANMAAQQHGRTAKKS